MHRKTATKCGRSSAPRFKYFTCLLDRGHINRGWFFYALNKHYRQNVNTNVSNARMNSPKVIKSLKSNFIRITSILCSRKEVNHPVTRLFHKIVYHNKKYISIKNVVFPAAYFCSATIYFLRFFPTKIQSCYHIFNRRSSDFHILNTFKFRKVTKNLMDCGLISVELVFVNPSIGREQL